ncbi:transmembrane protein 222 [Patella vulgata]|uniref:transmembrane protein 222 n=1 Tax=Patella vulgata TaxID=6465 RepID=UPI00217FDBE0|nr:transmembrane protein 222 [Patella vulgata]
MADGSFDRRISMSGNLEQESVDMSAQNGMHSGYKIDHGRSRYPHCVVWTPLPCITWLFPFIGHMGIASTSGVIRDFGGPYYVAEDNMTFGVPTRYWQFDLSKVKGGRETWDKCVYEASEEYKQRMHNLCCDNCHSHVAMALNLMNYDSSSSWNMIKLCFLMLIYGKFVSPCGFLKTWFPFLLLTIIVISVVLVLHL